jgi:hypothetical protein
MTTAVNTSPIVGTYSNEALSAKLVIRTANDANGDITGSFSMGPQTWDVKGTWNTSSMTPSAGFYFTGTNMKPTVMLTGIGASPNFQTFEHTTLTISTAQAGGIVTTVSGQFKRA